MVTVGMFYPMSLPLIVVIIIKRKKKWGEGELIPYRDE